MACSDGSSTDQISAAGAVDPSLLVPIIAVPPPLEQLSEAVRSSSVRRGRFTASAHQSADVVGKVLQADFGFRPRDADRPYDPANPASWAHTCRSGLLSFVGYF
jgi:hypothetical protein